MKNFMKNFAVLSLLGMTIGLLPLWSQESKENFIGKDMESFIQLVAKATGKTILYDDAVQNRKFSLSNLKAGSPEELFKVFQSVIELEGFILETTGEKNWETIKIKRNILGPWISTPVISSCKELDAIQHENVFVTAVLPLKYASTREVQVTLRALRMINPQAGNVAGIETSNTLIITDFAPNIKRVCDVIRQIDVPREENLTPGGSRNSGQKGYRTEAMVTPLESQGQYLFAIKVFETSDVKGISTEKLICSPRLICMEDKQASIQVSTDNEGSGIFADAFVPKPGTGEYATCLIYIKEKENTLSSSKFQFQLVPGKCPRKTE